MYLTITFIELRNPLQFFDLSRNGLSISRQLKQFSGAKMKNTGFWKKHYTMSLWPTQEDMKTFARSGAHLEAMKKSAKLATQIKTLTIESASFLPWAEAKSIVLKEGKTLNF